MATSTDYLARLVERADEAVHGIDDVERQRIAFGRVLDHLLSQDRAQTTIDGSARKLASDRAEPSNPDGVFAEVSQRTDAVAEYFKIDSEQVHDVFDVTNGNPSLTIHSTQLPESKANATREIALLVTGARTALGLDTETTHVRGIVDDYGRLDSRHFMETLTNMTELAVLGKRRSPNRIVRMKVRGAEKAETLIKRMLGE